eukprot:TRINITY_DN9013_c0_g1_i2.p1 TRINITY_DN9013_c0_g1~~TRINITY_DN9013_c0_g1_i2.p1  ORF type:complete len:756 (+),score=108.69 TRINITY_DN9013_c0_g1_i2:47-2314(+)
MSRDESRPRACVIGAGASGLVTAKYLLADGFEVVILEKSAKVGGVFEHKTYDQTRLVSSSTLTAFSDFRFPPKVVGGENGGPAQTLYSYHPTAPEYVDYLRRYATEFGLTSLIQYGVSVISVERVGKAGARGVDVDSKNSLPQHKYSVTMSRKTEDTKESAAESATFDVVAVCSGLHEFPHWPDESSIPGLAEFRAAAGGTSSRRVMHSSEYKCRKEAFRGKNVLIAGSGETAMDLAYRAASAEAGAKHVGMVCRYGMLSIPHAMTATKPLDTFITNVFEHVHEHPWVHALRVRWWLSGFFIRFFLFLIGGSAWGFNQWAFGPADPVARGWHIINKSDEAMPHLNAFAKRRLAEKGNFFSKLWARFWLWMCPAERDLKPVQPFGGSGRGIKRIVKRVADGGKEVFDVEFERCQKSMRDDDAEDHIFRDVDVIVFCTGYRQKFPFLSDEIRAGLSSRQRPARHAADEDPLPEEHFVVSTEDVGLGFIGFIRPNVGAIPPMAEMQVQWWLRRLRNNTIPVRPEQRIAEVFKPLMRVAEVAVSGIGSSHASTGAPSWSQHGLFAWYGASSVVSKNLKFVEEQEAPASYVVLGRKYAYGVDYGNYMHRLAEEIGSVPSMKQILLTGGDHEEQYLSLADRARLLFTYSMGQAFTPLFRLHGPYGSAACWKVARDELWGVIVQRGWLENLGLVSMNTLFLGINLTAFVLEFLLVCVLCWGMALSLAPFCGGLSSAPAEKRGMKQFVTALWAVPWRGFDRYG